MHDNTCDKCKAPQYFPNRHEPDYNAIEAQFGSNAAYAVMAAIDECYAQNKAPSDWKIVCIIDSILQNYL